MENKVNVTTIAVQNNFNISDKALKFVSSIVPEFIKDGVGIIADNVKSWRFQNQVKILSKTKKICEDNKIPLQAVNVKFITQLLENASLEEEENMQDRWSALLANAVKNPNEINPSFIDILRQLTSNEAIILNKLYIESSRKNNLKERNELQFSKEKIMQLFHLAVDQGH